MGSYIYDSRKLAPSPDFFHDADDQVSAALREGYPITSVVSRAPLRILILCCAPWHLFNQNWQILYEHFRDASFEIIVPNNEAPACDDPRFERVHYYRGGSNFNRFCRLRIPGRVHTLVISVANRSGWGYERALLSSLSVNAVKRAFLGADGAWTELKTVDLALRILGSPLLGMMSAVNSLYMNLSKNIKKRVSSNNG
ncbi:MAG: hypothetical protein ABH878_02690 [bacterium]